MNPFQFNFPLERKSPRATSRRDDHFKIETRRNQRKSPYRRARRRKNGRHIAASVLETRSIPPRSRQRNVASSRKSRVSRENARRRRLHRQYKSSPPSRHHSSLREAANRALRDGTNSPRAAQRKADHLDRRVRSDELHRESDPSRHSSSARHAQHALLHRPRHDRR